MPTLLFCLFSHTTIIIFLILASLDNIGHTQRMTNTFPKFFRSLFLYASNVIPILKITLFVPDSYRYLSQKHNQLGYGSFTHRIFHINVICIEKFFLRFDVYLSLCQDFQFCFFEYCPMIL